MLNTPVLFIIFNRPDYTKKVFAQIRKVKPTQLFIAADGPRANHPNDVKLCLQTREIIEKIDWDCDVKTLFRDENLGCAKGVSGAITWFFEHVEEGIILEDDCVPNLSFFTFCTLMLEKYRNTEGVMSISGSNYLFEKEIKSNNSYYFSAHCAIWGWATWKRAWVKISLNIEGWEDIEPVIAKRILNVDFRKNLMTMFEKVSNGTLDSWATPWCYHFHIFKGKTVTPSVNLITNIGEKGVHYNGFKSPLLNMKQISFDCSNIKMPSSENIDFDKDAITFKNLLNPQKRIIDRLYNKILSFCKKYFLKT
jgi:hypothetical protein